MAFSAHPRPALLSVALLFFISGVAAGGLSASRHPVDTNGADEIKYAKYALDKYQFAFCWLMDGGFKESLGNGKERVGLFIASSPPHGQVIGMTTVTVIVTHKKPESIHDFRYFPSAVSQGSHVSQC